LSVFCGHAIIPDMKGPPHSELEPYLDRLRTLPFIKQVDVQLPDRSGGETPDARLVIRTPKGRHDLVVEVKSVPISRSAAQSLVVRASHPPSRSWIAFSPFVSTPVGQFLASHRVAFLDEAGNCHLALGQDYLAHVEGRRRERPVRQGRGLGPRSYQVLFALLARPELVTAPIRSLAEAAGVRKTAAADLLQRLTEEGFVLRDKAGRRIVRADALVDRWATGYADKLRPRLLVGRYRAAGNDPLAFETHASIMLEAMKWAWGGATAAFKLTRHYRSSTTTIHVASPPATLQRQLGLLTANDGPIVLLDVPGPLGLQSSHPHVAHPLLVYAELLAEGNERALEAAGEIRSRFLGHIA
jgi:hypothetical protein